MSKHEFLWPVENIQATAYCACGDVLRYSGSVEGLEDSLEHFLDDHGIGSSEDTTTIHDPCDAKTARKGRRYRDV